MLRPCTLGYSLHTRTETTVMFASVIPSLRKASSATELHFCQSCTHGEFDEP